MKLQTKTLLSTLTAATALTVGQSAMAAIIYVDAAKIVLNAEEDAVVSGNTFATSTGVLGGTGWVINGTDNNAPKWGERGGFANGSNIFEGRSGSGGDDPITTQITDLADGLYDVWVFFWDAEGSNGWEITAGLTATLSGLDTYSFDGGGNTTAPVDASTLNFTTSILTTEGDRIMYGVNLGEQTVASGSAIEVFIEQLGGGSGSRTWYDGVGYELVPEPSSLALLAMGGLLIARRRRD